MTGLTDPEGHALSDTQPTLPPAGWHADPAGSEQLRYWDGSAWTDQLRDPAPADTAVDTGVEDLFSADAGIPAEPTAESALPDTAAQPTTVFPAEPREPLFSTPAPMPPPAPQSAGIPYPGQGYGAAPTGTPGRVGSPSEAGFFRSLFDLTFAADRIVTIKFARVLYVLAIVGAALSWVFGVFTFFIWAAVADEPSLNVLGIVHLLFGWIAPLLTVVGVRVLLEVMIAQIRTSQYTAQLVQVTVPSAPAAFGPRR